MPSRSCSPLTEPCGTARSVIHPAEWGATSAQQLCIALTNEASFGTDGAPDLVGVVLPGGWQVTRHVGEGGMAHVYEGMRDGDRAAIKVLHKALVSKPEIAFRFRREGELVDSIESPHVPKVLGRGKDATGRPWIAFEFVEGRELSAILDERGKLPPKVAVEIARQACEALRAAHLAGVVHRDVKPDNIIVDGSLDGEPSALRVKVLDFSVSKDEDLAFTQQGLVIGTPVYMAVEQAMGNPVTPAVDIYSLGAILYDMLSGKPPYDHDEPGRVLATLLTGPPTPLSRVDPTLPQILTAVVDRAMAREAKHRFPMIETLIDALDDVHRSLETPEEVAARLSLGIPFPAASHVTPAPVEHFPEPPRTHYTALIIVGMLMVLSAVGMILLKASL